MRLQVDKMHYDFANYVDIDRWSSFYYQLSNSISEDIDTILLIGVGDNIIEPILKSFGKKVTTLDFDNSLNPDIVGDIKELDEILNKEYDLIICCEVLEHLEFKYFEPILESMKRHANKKIVLSVPFNKIRFSMKFHLPKLGDFAVKIFIHKFWVRNWRIEKEGYEEHYWEVGLPQYSRKKIRNILKNHFNIEKEFIPIENTKHIFYILEK